MPIPNVQDLLNDLQRPEAPATKTAADGSAPDLGSARSALQAALHEVTTAQTKTASANPDDVSAMSELTKIAGDLATADEAGQIKSAQLYGAAAADGFIQRMNQFASNAPAPAPEATKVAADAEFATKLAADLGYSETENALHRFNAMATKQAADAQYAQQVAQQAPAPAQTQAAEKQASDERVRGIMAAAEKTAAAAEDCFVRGYEEMHKIAQVLT
jgi:hypothetical protein